MYKISYNFNSISKPKQRLFSKKKKKNSETGFSLYEVITVQTPLVQYELSNNL